MLRIDPPLLREAPWRAPKNLHLLALYQTPRPRVRPPLAPSREGHALNPLKRRHWPGCAATSLPAPAHQVWAPSRAASPPKSPLPTGPRLGSRAKGPGHTCVLALKPPAMTSPRTPGWPLCFFQSHCLTEPSPTTLHHVPASQATQENKARHFRARSGLCAPAQAPRCTVNGPGRDAPWPGTEGAAGLGRLGPQEHGAQGRGPGVWSAAVSSAFRRLTSCEQLRD